MYRIRLKLLMVFCCSLTVAGNRLGAQTAGGQTVYGFLRLPAGAQQTALGGENISVIANDVSTSFLNPALLRKNLHSQVAFTFTPIASGVKQLFGSGAFYKEKIATTFAAHIQYTGYGEIQQTDPSGNSFGTFNPRDYVVQVSASKQYQNHWFYGSAIKFIQSNYGAYRSSAIAMDIGVNYYDSARTFQAGLVIKNMGIQLRNYSGAGSENLPFDFQLGITKRLAKAPLQFSLTVRELHRLVLYKPDSTISTTDQIAQHFVLGVQAFIANRIELTTGYNHLRRRELQLPATANGLTGFSLGAGVLLSRFQCRYARSFYSNSKGYHQFSINARL